MQKLLLILLALGTSLGIIGISMARSDGSAANPHFVTGPTCHQTSPSTLVCSGKVAGLGSLPIYVVVNAPAGCINNGQHTPPGHRERMRS